MKNLPNTSKYLKYTVFAVAILMLLTLTGRAIINNSNLISRGPSIVIADDDGGSGDGGDGGSSGDCGGCEEEGNDNDGASDGNGEDDKPCPANTITEKYVVKVRRNGRIVYGYRCITPTPTPTPVVTPTPTPVVTPTPTPVVTPTPTPTPAVTPTPTPEITPTPTPSIVVEIVNENTNINENNINNEFNPSINITNEPQVIGVATTEAKTLPKTGLPLVAWAFTGLLPVGLRLRKVNKSSHNQSANFIWEERQLIK